MTPNQNQRLKFQADFSFVAYWCIILQLCNIFPGNSGMNLCRVSRHFHTFAQLRRRCEVGTVAWCGRSNTRHHATICYNMLQWHMHTSCTSTYFNHFQRCFGASYLQPSIAIHSPIAALITFWIAPVRVLLQDLQGTRSAKTTLDPWIVKFKTGM